MYFYAMFSSMFAFSGSEFKQEMSLKKTNGVGLKKGENALVHESYTDDKKLTMIIFKYQWTAILNDFVRK